MHMSQDGKPVLHAMVRTAADGSGPTTSTPMRPTSRKPDELQTMEELIGAEAARHYPFWDNVERWPIAQELPEPGGDPVVLDWTRFRPTARFDDPSWTPRGR